MEKTTSHEGDESVGFDRQTLREFQDAQVRIEVADIAARERVDLAEIASNERMHYVRLDALFRLARYALDCIGGRHRSAPLRCVFCTGAAPMPAPVDLRATTGRVVRDVAPDSST